MRACWLKWVGRDWSISADYIWLNYSGANIGKRCSALSGGELRRVYLWSAISRKSSVLVLDEPTTGLDAVSRAELAAYVKRNKQSQLIIVVSHDDEMVGAVEGVVDLGSMYQGK